MRSRNSGRSQREAVVSEWGDLSISRHKGSCTRRICKGTPHSPGKKSPVLASLVRYFLLFALDKYSVLRWQVFREKEKILMMIRLWWMFAFVILLLRFVRMVGNPPRSAMYAMSFCNNQQLFFCSVMLRYRFLFVLYVQRSESPQRFTNSTIYVLFFPFL